MGSGSSSNVEPIQIDQHDKSLQARKKKNPNKDISNPQQILSETVTEPRASESANSEVETLTKQLCESESLRLDLEDKVEALMKELENVDAQNIKDEEKQCNETVYAKDQYISNLEKEKKDLETEAHKLKLKQKRKQRQFNTQMAEYKQEVNFQMMELRDEITKLKSENKKLAGKNGNDLNNDEDEVTKKLPGGEKMALILELSNQVAEQEDKISKLEKKLKDKDHVISEMRAKMKNNAQYLSVINDKPVDKTSLKLNAGDSDRNDSNNNASKYNVNTRLIGVAAASSSAQCDVGKHKSNNKYDQLFTLTEEQSDNEEGNLTKLSSFMKDVRAKNDKVRISTESLNVDQHSSSPGIRNLGGVFEDAEGNTGRDSGLGSAGKRDDVEKKPEGGSNVNLKSWKDSTASFESGSGLSDSDFDGFPASQSKIYSAPPKLQNGGGGVKLKKKSNSLRRHASKKDRPPRPGEAFVNTSSFSSDDHIINKLTPIIGRVEVS